MTWKLSTGFQPWGCQDRSVQGHLNILHASPAKPVAKPKFPPGGFLILTPLSGRGAVTVAPMCTDKEEERWPDSDAWTFALQKDLNNPCLRELALSTRQVCVVGLGRIILWLPLKRDSKGTQKWGIPK